MLQAPGPRGSPHEPHALIGRSENDLAGLLDCAANADSRFCSSAPSHDGHAGDWPARVRYSN